MWRILPRPSRVTRHLGHHRSVGVSQNGALSLKILIVDDDKICRRVNSESLRRVGYDTIEAGSAKEAFDLLEGGEPIVLIITDIRMPETSGLDFVARLRSDPSLAKIPIIICTGLETKAWLDQVELFGVSAYSPKPVNANHLRGKIGKILQEEPWPLEETIRTLLRLDISVEDYFACVEDLIKQLDDLIARSENQAQPMAREELSSELEALAGAAQNLGATRLAGVLNRETEIVRGIPEGQRIAASPALKRESGMLRLSMLILMKEHEESVVARSAGRVITRQAGKEMRWKTGLVAKQPSSKIPNMASSEPPITSTIPDMSVSEPTVVAETASAETTESPATPPPETSSP
jgi:two-component system, chemotaxis family, chemotaxis protein CheY